MICQRFTAPLRSPHSSRGTSNSSSQKASGFPATIIWKANLDFPPNRCWPQQEEATWRLWGGGSRVKNKCRESEETSDRGMGWMPNSLSSTSFLPACVCLWTLSRIQGFARPSFNRRFSPCVNASGLMGGCHSDVLRFDSDPADGRIHRRLGPKHTNALPVAAPPGGDKPEAGKEQFSTKKNTIMPVSTPPSAF